MPSPETAVLLHVGTHKTGTTSIQQVLSAHAERLEAEGILYPASGRPSEDVIKYGHHALARNAIDFDLGRTAETTVIQDVLREIEEKRPRRVIISSEDLWHQNAVEPIANAFRDIATDIVVSLRRQDEFLNAMYYTAVCRERHGLSPEEYAAAADLSPLDYLAMIERYRKAFPRATLTIRLYERGKSPRVDAVGDFMEVANLDHLITKEAGLVYTHKTLPARAVAALRALSTTNLTDLEFYDIFDATHVAMEGKSEEVFSYSPGFRAELMRKHHDANVEIRHRYCDGRKASIFEETPFEPEEEWRQRVVWGDEAVARLMHDISSALRSHHYSAP